MAGCDFGVADHPAIAWTIPDNVVDQSRIVGGDLYVANTSGQWIEVDQATGAELSRSSDEPLDIPVGERWGARLIDSTSGELGMVLYPASMPDCS